MLILFVTIPVQALCTSRPTVIISILFVTLFAEIVEHSLIKSLCLVSFDVLKNEFVSKLKILLACIILEHSLDKLGLLMCLFFCEFGLALRMIDHEHCSYV